VGTGLGPSLLRVGRGGGTHASSETGMMKVVFVGASTTMLFTACGAVVVMFHISRATKTLLRAVDVNRR